MVKTINMYNMYKCIILRAMIKYRITTTEKKKYNHQPQKREKRLKKSLGRYYKKNGDTPHSFIAKMGPASPVSYRRVFVVSPSSDSWHNSLIGDVLAPERTRMGLPYRPAVCASYLFVLEGPS